MKDHPDQQRELTPEEMIMRLDRDIRKFKIDFERFFSGNLPIPPDQLRMGIQNQLKELRTIRLKAVSDRFRFNTLEAKFNALVVLFNRRLREHEQGFAGPRQAAEANPTLDAIEGVVIDERPSAEAVRTLYDELYSGPESGPKADYDRFESYLQKQAEQIRAKTGCKEVRFRITSEKGKLKLKAKPV